MRLSLKTPTSLPIGQNLPTVLSVPAGPPRPWSSETALTPVVPPSTGDHTPENDQKLQKLKWKLVKQTKAYFVWHTLILQWAIGWPGFG